MGLRETINRNPTAATVVSLVLLFAIVGVVIWQQFSTSVAVQQSSLTPKLFFTVDDGKTYFADDAAKRPPFDKDGKPAVEAMVFKDLDTNETFVGYLRRYTPSGLKVLQAVDAKQGTDRRMMTEGLVVEQEVKKPGTGDSGWVRTNDPRSAPIQMVTGSKGGNNLEPVIP